MANDGVRMTNAGRGRGVVALLLVLFLCVGPALAERTCGSCGAKNSDEAKFCKSCGAKLPELQSRPSVPRVSGSVSVEAGTAYVTSSPSGATVIIDGRTRGTTPLNVSDLAPGRHELTLSRDGYRDYNTTFAVSGQFGTIVVTSEPVGAEISLDGQVKGRTLEAGLALARVPQGRHTLVARLPGYQDVTKTVDLRSAGPIAVSFRLGWGKGFLSVTSVPKGASLTLDNQSAGTTPYFAELSPARYYLTMAKPGYFEWAGFAEVQFAETLRIAAELERIRHRSPVLLGLGIAVASGTGFAAYLGGQSYAKYQSATDGDSALSYRQATQRWDMLRNVGAAMSAAIVASFVVLRF
jgi:hypothetical protein